VRDITGACNYFSITFGNIEICLNKKWCKYNSRIFIKRETYKKEIKVTAVIKKNAKQSRVIEDATPYPVHRSERPVLGMIPLHN